MADTFASLLHAKTSLGSLSALKALENREKLSTPTRKQQSVASNSSGTFNHTNLGTNNQSNVHSSRSNIRGSFTSQTGSKSGASNSVLARAMRESERLQHASDIARYAESTTNTLQRMNKRIPLSSSRQSSLVARRFERLYDQSPTPRVLQDAVRQTAAVVSAVASPLPMPHTPLHHRYSSTSAQPRASDLYTSRHDNYSHTHLGKSSVSRLSSYAAGHQIDSVKVGLQSQSPRIYQHGQIYPTEGSSSMDRMHKSSNQSVPLHRLNQKRQRDQPHQRLIASGMHSPSPRLSTEGRLLNSFRSPQPYTNSGMSYFTPVVRHSSNHTDPTHIGTHSAIPRAISHTDTSRFPKTTHRSTVSNVRGHVSSLSARPRNAYSVPKSRYSTNPLYTPRPRPFGQVDPVVFADKSMTAGSVSATPRQIQSHPTQYSYPPSTTVQQEVLPEKSQNKNPHDPHSMQSFTSMNRQSYGDVHHQDIWSRNMRAISLASAMDATLNLVRARQTLKQNGYKLGQFPSTNKDQASMKRPTKRYRVSNVIKNLSNVLSDVSESSDKIDEEDTASITSSSHISSSPSKTDVSSNRLKESKKTNSTSRVNGRHQSIMSEKSSKHRSIGSERSSEHRYIGSEKSSRHRSIGSDGTSSGHQSIVSDSPSSVHGFHTTEEKNSSTPSDNMRKQETSTQIGHADTMQQADNQEFATRNPRQIPKRNTTNLQDTIEKNNNKTNLHDTNQQGTTDNTNGKTKDERNTKNMIHTTSRNDDTSIDSRENISKGQEIKPKKRMYGLLSLAMRSAMNQQNEYGISSQLKHSKDKNHTNRHIGTIQQSKKKNSESASDAHLKQSASTTKSQASMSHNNEKHFLTPMKRSKPTPLVLGSLALCAPKTPNVTVKSFNQSSSQTNKDHKLTRSSSSMSKNITSTNQTSKDASRRNNNNNKVATLMGASRRNNNNNKTITLSDQTQKKIQRGFTRGLATLRLNQSTSLSENQTSDSSDRNELKSGSHENATSMAESNDTISTGRRSSRRAAAEVASSRIAISVAASRNPSLASSIAENETLFSTPALQKKHGSRTKSSGKVGKLKRRPKKTSNIKHDPLQTSSSSAPLSRSTFSNTELSSTVPEHTSVSENAISANTQLEESYASDDQLDLQDDTAESDASEDDMTQQKQRKKRRKLSKQGKTKSNKKQTIGVTSASTAVDPTASSIHSNSQESLADMSKPKKASKRKKSAATFMSTEHTKLETEISEIITSVVNQDIQSKRPIKGRWLRVKHALAQKGYSLSESSIRTRAKALDYDRTKGIPQTDVNSSEIQHETNSFTEKNQTSSRENNQTSSRENNETSSMKHKSSSKNDTVDQKKSESNKHIVLARKGTLKRRRQVRALLEDATQQNTGDDIFSAGLYSHYTKTNDTRSKSTGTSLSHTSTSTNSIGNHNPITSDMSTEKSSGTHSTISQTHPTEFTKDRTSDVLDNTTISNTCIIDVSKASQHLTHSNTTSSTEGIDANARSNSTSNTEDIDANTRSNSASNTEDIDANRPSNTTGKQLNIEETSAKTPLKPSNSRIISTTTTPRTSIATPSTKESTETPSTEKSIVTPSTEQPWVLSSGASSFNTSFGLQTVQSRKRASSRLNADTETDPDFISPDTAVEHEIQSQDESSIVRAMWRDQHSVKHTNDASASSAEAHVHNASASSTRTQLHTSSNIDTSSTQTDTSNSPQILQRVNRDEYDSYIQQLKRTQNVGSKARYGIQHVASKSIDALTRANNTNNMTTQKSTSATTTSTATTTPHASRPKGKGFFTPGGTARMQWDVEEANESLQGENLMYQVDDDGHAYVVREDVSKTATSPDSIE